MMDNWIIIDMTNGKMDGSYQDQKGAEYAYDLLTKKYPDQEWVLTKVEKVHRSLEIRDNLFWVFDPVYKVLNKFKEWSNV